MYKRRFKGGWEDMKVLLLVLGSITFIILLWYLLFGGEIRIRLYNPFRYLNK